MVTGRWTWRNRPTRAPAEKTPLFSTLWPLPWPRRVGSEAVAAAERATQIAETQSNRDLTAQLQSDLALYRARKPIPAAKQSP